MPVKEWTILAGEAVGLGAVGLVAHRLGLTETFFNLAASMVHTDLLLAYIKDAANGVVGDPEKLRPAIMAAGFAAGATVDILASLGILGWLLKPQVTATGEQKSKIVLAGTHNYRVKEDVVAVKNCVCVDARQPRSWQDEVEPGAGQMGGALVNGYLFARVIDMLGDGLGNDFITSYLIGRTAPTAALSAVLTMRRAIKAGFGVRQLENQIPHDNNCTWSTTESALKMYLKFSPIYHELNTVILDGWNRLDEFTNTLLWEPLMNLPAFFLSRGRYRIPMNFGRVALKA